MPPAAPPELEDIQADAEAFADAAMAARMDRGGAWGEWTGDNDYRMAFEVRIAHALAVARSLCDAAYPSHSHPTSRLPCSASSGGAGLRRDRLAGGGALA
jgi:hypothetical protein